jgi:multidrug efflux pump subunit AcrA (membrane-fusion protein)
VDPRKCYFECNIEAGLSADLTAGKKVQLLIDNSGAPIKVEATLVFVSPVVDSASGLQRIKAIFDNADGQVRPGLAGKLILR